MNLSLAWWCRLDRFLLCCVLFVLAPDARPASPQMARIVVLGDSITAGYGLDPSEAYPALVQARIREAGLPFTVVNAGLSGDTTSGGVRRLDWVLRQGADVLILALGGNDGLRGIQPEVTRSNLVYMARRAVERHPGVKVLIAGMQMPPNMGEEYARNYQALFPAAAAETGAVLIPFLLEGVGGKPEFNQPDLIHPTGEGQRRIADTVWNTLEKVLRAFPVPPK